MAYQVLDDVKVIELAQGVSGPFAGKLLSNWGAQVIKVEPPDGDRSRRMGPFPEDIPSPEASGWFLYLNTAKQGVTLDTGTALGQRLLKRLLAEADVLIEDLPSERAEELGLGYEALEAMNPKLIVSSVTPFGKKGPYADYKATDIVLQAMGGYMSLNGDPDKAPLQIPLEFGQLMAGRQAALATMMALHYQRETGEGQHIDISELECVLSEPSYMITWYTYMGGIEARGRGFKRKPVGGALKETRDGWIALTSDGGNPWEKFGPFFGLPELTDPKYASQSGRMQHWQEVEALISPKLKEREKMEIFTSGMKEGFVFGPVQTPEELLACPQLKERSFFQEIEHPVAGRLRYSGPGNTFVGRQPTSAPAPLLGQHNHAVYCQRLGYSQEDLVRLRGLGVV
ncbi:MAG: CoA transferase [Chloroflexi bacterium]|nr:CoA transferase [Chloroflexota bacterium]